VRRRVAVADRIAHHQRHESMLAGIDRRRAHAAGRGHAGDQQRVYSERMQSLREPGFEERAGVLLGEHGLRRQRLEPFAECSEFRMPAALEARERGELAEEHAAVAAARFIGDIRVHHRDTGTACGGQQSHRGITRAFDAGVEGRTGSEIGTDKIDDNQCRLPAGLQGPARGRAIDCFRHPRQRFNAPRAAWMCDSITEAAHSGSRASSASTISR
jgi:ribosomal protein L15